MTPRPMLNTARAVLAAVALTAALVAALVALAPGAALAGPSARASSSCSPPRYPGSGYFTSLTVSGTSCSTGRRLVISYYHCRLRHGAAGRCTSSVEGFRCTEKRQSIPTEVDGRVTCRRGGATVTHSYQQNI